MSFEFTTAAADLEAYLRPLLPAKWRLQDSGKPLGKTTGVALTYTQGNTGTDVTGATLPNGQVALDFMLILSTPETDPMKGWPRLNREAPHLFRALDARADLLWQTAERGVLDTGEAIYLIPVQVIAAYDTTPAV